MAELVVPFKMDVTKTIWIFLFILNTTFCLCKKYVNYTLYRGMPINENHLEFFKNLTDMYDVNVWRPPGTIYKPVDFIIKPTDEEDFLREADKRGIYITTLIKDVQSEFDKQTVTSYIRRNIGSYNWNTYYRLKDIYSWLNDMAKMYPNEMFVKSIGKTVQGRDIMSAKIILRGSKRRSKVVIEGGIHAREWIAPAFVTYMINEIIHAPQGKNKQLQNISLTYEWFFIPVANPDGYEYSHKEDRLWRKNRSKPDGVDVNRNFDVAFGEVGVRKNPYHNIYCGEYAFSERESKALADFVHTLRNSLEYYVAFHSYGQDLVIPYAYTKKHTGNFDVVSRMANSTAKVISRRYNTEYTTGTAYDTVGYTASGVSACWVKKTYGTPYVISFELRDEGKYGFALPTSKILPTCEETMDGLLDFLKPQSRKFILSYNMSESTTDRQTIITLNTCLLVCYTVILLFRIKT